MPKTFPHYDVIIIGAGSIGAPTAFYLAQAGLRVLVIDREPSPGQGSNKTAIGGIRATHSDPAKVHLCLRSLEIFSTWQEIYGDDIEWNQGGYCFVAYRKKEESDLKELLITQKQFGLNIEWLDRYELLKVIPDLNRENLIGGTYSPQDGNISPLLANHSFYNQALKKNVKFHFNEYITEIITQQGRIVGVRTNRAIYGTDYMVNAAGAWAQQINNLINLEFPIKPESHEAAITEPVARFFDAMVVDIRPIPGSSNFYFYQHKTGQILFCLTPEPLIEGFDTRETSSFLPLASNRILDIMPRLQTIRVRRTWRGLYPMTPDSLPIVGQSHSIQGCLLAIGMCGQGVMLGPGIAELLTRLILNTLTTEDLDILKYLSPDRQFTRQEILK